MSINEFVAPAAIIMGKTMSINDAIKLHRELGAYLRSVVPSKTDTMVIPSSVEQVDDSAYQNPAVGHYADKKSASV